MFSAKGQPGIVVGTDGSAASRYAVDWAAREAAMRNVPLMLVHIVQPVGATVPYHSSPTFLRWLLEHGQRALDDGADIARAAGGRDIDLNMDVLFSPVIPTLVELSGKAQTLVVGSRGHGPVARGLLGSVSSSVVRQAHCPVAVIHDEDPPMADLARAPVLVGIDGSAVSDLATGIAFDEASRRGVGLTALHVWSDVEVTDFPAVDWPALKPAAKRVLAERLAGWQE